jgi:hypothetical protein
MNLALTNSIRRLARRPLHTPVRWLAVLLVALSVSSCASQYIGDESSPFYSVPVGSRLQLVKEITIPGGQVAMYAQNGEMKHERDVDYYQPNCKFEIYTMSDQPRTVKPDVFTITKVVDDIESSSIGRPAVYASRDSRVVMSVGMLDRSLVFNYATQLFLHSDLQPDVYRMTCQHWESVSDDRYLSIEQMRQAMGSVFSLQIPSGNQSKAH